jgi:50S ribosomal subunit-associated GTPase HflX
LNDINASHVPAINVLNKVDLLPDASSIAKLKRTFPGMLTISAARSLKLSDLKIKIKEAIEESYETVDVKFSYRDSKLISKIQENVIVLERDYMNEYVKLKLRGSKARINKILSMVN